MLLFYSFKFIVACEQNIFWLTCWHPFWKKEILTHKMNWRINLLWSCFTSYVQLGAFVWVMSGWLKAHPGSPRGLCPSDQELRSVGYSIGGRWGADLRGLQKHLPGPWRQSGHISRKKMCRFSTHWQFCCLTVSVVSVVWSEPIIRPAIIIRHLVLDL